MPKDIDALARLRAYVKQAGSQTAAAKSFKVSLGFLNQTLSGHRPISDRLAKAIGLRRIVVYRVRR